MTRRWLNWIFGTIGALLVLVLVALLWVLNTASGTRTALRLVQNAMDGKLAIERVEGTIAGPLKLHGVRFADAALGVEATVEAIAIDLALLELIGMRVHVTQADIDGLDVLLSEPSVPAAPPEPSEPFDMQAPIDLIVERFMLRDAVVRRADAMLVKLDSLALDASWIGRDVTVKRLDVRSPDGQVQFAGSASRRAAYRGEGNGQFDWQVGETRYRGTLEVRAPNDEVAATLALAAPLRATVNIGLVQQTQWPWKFALDVPAFDPRKSLLPESDWESLAATLQGSGTLQRGTVQGEIVLNGVPLRFEQLAYERVDERIDVLAKALLGGGTFDAAGWVMPNAEPANAKIEAKWSSLTLPQEWLGRVLQTQGTLVFDGSAESYRAVGELDLGPPDRLARIELDVLGSPSSVALRQLDVVQRDGRLAATGTIELEPRIGWKIDVDARRFNPGDFAPEWPGELSFALATEGAIEDEGPAAKVRLRDLTGRLRGRAVAGVADMTLASDKSLSGTADLRSGASRIQLQAKVGEGTDALARIDIPSLSDWLPDASGALHGTVSALGRWPNLTIDGQVRGRALAFGEMRAASLQLNMDVTNPTAPDGFVEVRLRDAVVPGFDIARLDATASGNREAHSLALQMRGAPLAAELELEGGLVEEVWNGTIQALVLDIKDAARLVLQEPVTLSYSPDETRVSSACLADGDIRLCLEGAMRADGSLAAQYSLADVPLDLANAFLGKDSAFAVSGTLRGEGTVARTAEGELSGRAQLAAPRIELASNVSDVDDNALLLRVADLDVAADFAGERAQARLVGKLNDTGSLNAEVELQGLGQPEASVQGTLAAQLPSIAVVELFVPQLADVSGALDLRAEVSGALEQPRIAGALKLVDLAADVPELGLQLREGNFAIVPREEQAFGLEGRVRSGDGQLTVSGVARIDGPSTVTIEGRQFLAADMPGARVFIEPDLSIEHVPERITVKGKVTVPTATIDLQELPGGGGGGAAISSDVVIVDEEAQEQAEQSLPVYADVTVALGEKVELAGFGLVANVRGQLAVRERPGEPTVASGEIRVGGTYKAYGQDLTIQQGSLLFANTPLDNPNLRIVAVRQVGTVTAGLRVGGTAKSPVLTVFSEPEMGQANALSYLVAGKPLDQIGEGEGDALQTAARSLGTAAGGLLAKNLGKRFGIDEIGIKDEEMIGGSAFTIGQYLSPRLFLSYGVGLFEPGEVVTLRYRLTEELAAQAQSGTEESRAGIQYRVER